MIEIKRNRQAAETPAARAQMPAERLDGKKAEELAHKSGQALNREFKPFTGIDSARDYRAMYRAVFEYHEDHNPPLVECEYWKTHKPGLDDTPETELEYWKQAAQDVSSVCSAFHDDPFFIGLMVDVYDELGREYEARRQAAARDPGKKAGDGND